MDASTHMILSRLQAAQERLVAHAREVEYASLGPEDMGDDRLHEADNLNTEVKELLEAAKEGLDGG